MKKIRMQYLWGGLLIILGIVFLLQEFTVIGSAFNLLWAILLGVGGVFFLWAYATNEAQWWASIPGMTLIGLTAVVFEDMFPIFSGKEWLGAIFLAFVGLGFWLVYFRRQSFWWAIIPGGTLVTLGLVAGLGNTSLPNEGIFFLGLGITFALVGLLPAKEYNLQWAYIPAAILAVLGLAQLTLVGAFLTNFWPVLLIIVGGYVIFRNWKK